MTGTFLLEPGILHLFAQGLLKTLHISLVASCLAIATGLVTAFCRMSPSRILRGLAVCYVELFRNTPLLIQLYLYYRGLQSIGITLPPVTCGILALGLYTGAYLTEVFRSGLQSVPPAQEHAGRSLGFNRLEVFWWVLLPQAFHIVLPPLNNQLLNLMKNSSLVAFITVSDLFYVVYKGAVDAFRPVEYFVAGAALYVTVSLVISGIIRLLEQCSGHHRWSSLQTAKVVAQ